MSRHRPGRMRPKKGRPRAPTLYTSTPTVYLKVSAWSSLISYPDLTLSYAGHGRSRYEIRSNVVLKPFLNGTQETWGTRLITTVIHEECKQLTESPGRLSVQSQIPSHPTRLRLTHPRSPKIHVNSWGYESADITPSLQGESFLAGCSNAVKHKRPLLWRLLYYSRTCANKRIPSLARHLLSQLTNWC